MQSNALLRHAVRKIGHGAREIATIPQALALGYRPRLAVFPSGSTAPSGDLRAYAIGRALRRRGWYVMLLPKQIGSVQRKRLLGLFRPDLLLFQTCRHEFNDANHAMGYRWVLDLDDADFVDPLMSRRLERAASGAAGIIAGSRFIRDWARRFNPQVRVIWTGTPKTEGDTPNHYQRSRIVAWAQASPLGYPQELSFVSDLHARLVSDGIAFKLRLYGIKTPAEAARIYNKFIPGSDLELLPHMSYKKFLLSLRDVAVGLSPIVTTSPFSRGKSFGKILGYLDAGVPVVCSDAADHALFFKEESGVVSSDMDVWAAAIARLLSEPESRNAMALQASHDFRSRLSIDAAADLTDRFLREIMNVPGHSHR